jgi:hypothetical protein
MRFVSCSISFIIDVKKRNDKKEQKNTFSEVSTTVMVS